MNIPDNIPPETATTANVTLGLDLFVVPPTKAGTRTPLPTLRSGLRLTA